MAVFCVAIGNSLRGDDGAAHRVLSFLRAGKDATLRHVVQLTPELACEMAPARIVIFIDADPSAVEPRAEPVAACPASATPLAHSMTVAEVLHLAQVLYGFAGAAFLCRVPAAAFEGESLSPLAEAGARAAAEMIRELFLQHILEEG